MAPQNRQFALIAAVHLERMRPRVVQWTRRVGRQIRHVKIFRDVRTAPGRPVVQHPDVVAESLRVGVADVQLPPVCEASLHRQFDRRVVPPRGSRIRELVGLSSVRRDVLDDAADSPAFRGESDPSVGPRLVTASGANLILVATL